MREILADILDTKGYLENFDAQKAKIDSKKVRCPNCGHGGCSHHGQYMRKPPKRGDGEVSNDPEYEEKPIPILRFRCLHCRRTFSHLPQYLPIARHYAWDTQAEALLAYFTLGSYWAVAKQLGIDRNTIRRWVRGFKRQFIQHSDVLRPFFRELIGYAQDWVDFWQTWLAEKPMGLRCGFVIMIMPVQNIINSGSNQMQIG
jgi:transposase-like protein